MNIKRGLDQHRLLSIILGDVDVFKEYNYTYGHPAADKALKLVIQILTACCRANDEVARYGGGMNLPFFA